MKRKLAIAAMVISLFILLVVTVWVIFYLPKAWFLPLMFDAVILYNFKYFYDKIRRAEDVYGAFRAQYRKFNEFYKNMNKPEYISANLEYLDNPNEHLKFLGNSILRYSKKLRENKKMYTGCEKKKMENIMQEVNQIIAHC